MQARPTRCACWELRLEAEQPDDAAAPTRVITPGPRAGGAVELCASQKGIGDEQQPPVLAIPPTW